jgi:hypothetical protein
LPALFRVSKHKTSRFEIFNFMMKNCLILYLDKDLIKWEEQEEISIEGSISKRRKLEITQAGKKAESAIASPHQL